jgi:hypothetical protein
VSAVIVAPTDAQLTLIDTLCRERGFEFPPAVHSMREASEIITAIQLGQYDPSYYRPGAEPCEFCGDGPCRGCDADERPF